MKEKVILVTISDDRAGRKDGKYAETQDKIHTIFFEGANDDFGINCGLMMNFDGLEKTEFYEKNKTLLSNIDAGINGRAYKPYVISRALASIADGDYLIYTDCSPEIWNMPADFRIDPEVFDIEILKGLCTDNNDILTAFVKWDEVEILEGQLGIHTHANFTLNRCITKMGMHFYEDGYMHASGMWVIRKTPDTVDFVEKWLMWNCIDECASLGKADVAGDDSFWREELDYKKGHRHDQSISGLLLCARNQKFVDIVYNDMHPYNPLQFARKGVEYKFIESLPKIDKGDIVGNAAGVQMKVWRIDKLHGRDYFIVGQLEQSCYGTSRENLLLIEKNNE